MSRVTKVFCDVCDEAIGNLGWYSVSVQALGPNLGSYNKHYDVCGNCMRTTLPAVMRPAVRALPEHELSEENQR